jgi:hypothetical protein
MIHSSQQRLQARSTRRIEPRFLREIALNGPIETFDFLEGCGQILRRRGGQNPRHVGIYLRCAQNLNRPPHGRRGCSELAKRIGQRIVIQHLLPRHTQGHEHQPTQEAGTVLARSAVNEHRIRAVHQQSTENRAQVDRHAYRQIPIRSQHESPCAGRGRISLQHFE